MEVITLSNSWCCFVDSSWVAYNQKACIGWILMDHKGRWIMKGSTSIDLITSSLEAKAYALRDAVQQIKRHGYRNATSCGDSKVTLDKVESCMR